MDIRIINEYGDFWDFKNVLEVSLKSDATTIKYIDNHGECYEETCNTPDRIFINKEADNE